MKLHHQECYESEVYVGANHHIVIKQLLDRDTSFTDDATMVFLTVLQAEELLKALPDLIEQSKFNAISVISVPEVQDED